MQKTMVGLSVVMLLLAVSTTNAADAPHAAGTDAATTRGEAEATAHPHQRPVLPENSPLPGTMLIVIFGLFFLPAAIVGPVVRYHAPDQVPDASSHDEHGAGAHDAHGHDRAHGH